MTTSRPKYSLSYSYCHQIGTNYAAFGVKWDVLLAELVRDGFSRNGLTVRRAKRAYDQQIARG